jgi:ADP-ribose pyrophosphatase YjhB (NUDIX family)
MTTTKSIADGARAALAEARAILEKANWNRWPAGAPNQKGGQFAPKGTSGGGKTSDQGTPTQGAFSMFGGGPKTPIQWPPLVGSLAGHGMPPKAPPPGAKPHLKLNDKGERVTVNYPSKASDPATWTDAGKTATWTPGSKAPAELNGVAMAPWKKAPKSIDEWAKVPGQNPKLEQDNPFTPAEGKMSVGAGVIIQESDGRLWLTKPTNEFGGYVHTFPKGTVESGLSLQASAIKEAYEETGLKVKIVGVLGDFERSTSKARFYIARRVGGTPNDMGWESQAVRLVPAKQLKQLLNRQVDKDIVDAFHQLTELNKHLGEPDPVDKAKNAWMQQPRWPAGTSIGGQWKVIDGDGVTMPPKIAGGLESKNPQYQKKANAIYGMAKAGDIAGAIAEANKLAELGQQKMMFGGKSSHNAWHGAVGIYAAQLAHDLTEKPKAVAAAAKADGPQPISAWAQVAGKPGGSNPGAIYKDADGTKWLVKGNAQFVQGKVTPQQSDDRAKNEVLAAELVKAAGHGAPDMKLVDLGGKHGGAIGVGSLGVASKMIDGLTAFNKNDPAHVAAAQKAFATHAWLANYDVIGASFDNMMMRGAQAVNIDTGGALLFRAQGLPKKEFGINADEWDSMRDPKVNPNAAAIFGKMTADQLKESAKALANVSDETLVKLVAAHGPGDTKAKDDLIFALKIRRLQIFAKAGLDDKGQEKVLTPPKPSTGAKPTLDAKAIMPTFNSGFANADAKYAHAAQLAAQAHAAGDLAALKGATDAALKSGLWGGGANADKLKTYFGTLMKDLVAADAKATAAGKIEGAVTTDRSGQKWKNDGGVMNPQPPAGPAAPDAPKPALPNFEAAKIDTANSNAPSHNSKIDQIHELAAKGDVKGILALPFGSNTYAVKQVKIANATLAALGSQHTVQLKQKSFSHAALVDPGKLAKETAVAAAAVAAKTVKVAESQIPTPPNFSNWQGQGKGLSSSAAVNQMNDQAVQQIKTAALAGNLDALKAMTFAEISKETGQPTGNVKPMGEHPSKHVQSYFYDAINALDEVINPPKPLGEFNSHLASSVNSIARKFQAKPFGTTVNTVSSQEKFGYWIALGSAKVDIAAITPKKTADVPKPAIDQAYNDYKSLSPAAKSFISSMQGSGAFADAYRTGQTHYGGKDLKQLSDAAHKAAKELPPGTTIYRWQNMPAGMLKQVEKAPAGLVIQATGPMPTSYSPTATSGFGKHRLKIHFAPGAKAVMSFGSGKFSGEKEITTLPHTRFVLLSKKKVTDVEHSSSEDRWEIELLMLPPSE